METEGSLPQSQVPPVRILSQLDPIHTPTSHSPKIHLNIILPSTPGSPKWCFPLRFPHQNPVYASLLPPYALHAPPISFFSILFGEQYTSLISSLCSFLHSPVTSSLLGPNILLNALFSNTHSLRTSLNVSDQVSHPYKTTGKIIVHHSLPSVFLRRTLRERGHLEDPGVDGRTLECIFRKMLGWVWCLKTGQVAGSCERGNEPSGSVNCGEIVDYPRD